MGGWGAIPEKTMALSFPMDFSSNGKLGPGYPVWKTGLSEIAKAIEPNDFVQALTGIYSLGNVRILPHELLSA